MIRTPADYVVVEAEHPHIFEVRRSNGSVAGRVFRCESGQWGTYGSLGVGPFSLSPDRDGAVAALVGDDLSPGPSYGRPVAAELAARVEWLANA